NQSPQAIHIVLSVLSNVVCIVLFSSFMEMTIKIFSYTRHTSFNGFNILFCFLLGIMLTPVIYIFYNHQHKQQKRIHGLQSALGKTSADLDRKSTRLNSSHVKISYAVFCL